MTLGELIKCLESLPRDAVIRWGLGDACSWRGDYAQLAFKPVEGLTVADCLKYAKSCVGKQFEGYKGGCYTMTLKTNVYWDSWGRYRENRITDKYLKGENMFDLEATLEERFAWIHEKDVDPDEHVCYTDIPDLIKYMKALLVDTESLRALNPDLLIGRIDRTTEIDIEGDRQDFWNDIVLAISRDGKALATYDSDRGEWYDVQGKSDIVYYYPVLFDIKQPTVTFKGVEITKAEFEQLRILFEDSKE